MFRSLRVGALSHRRWRVWIALLLAAAGITAVVPAAHAATACQVVYSVQSDWGSGFTANVTINNVGDPLSNWSVGFAFPGNQHISSGWSANWTQSAANVTATNMSWNGSIPTNGSTTIGFQATYSGTNAPPTAFSVNGTACTGPNAAPTASLTSPTAGQHFTAPATVPLAATAADPDGSIAKVEFWVDGSAGQALAGTDTTSPYSFSWANVPAGSYSLTARAFDNKGATADSAPVGITVDPNLGPTVKASATSVSVDEGKTATYGLTLSAAPTANVTVATARTSGSTVLSVTGGASLTFTPANWNVAQNVTVTSAADTDANNDTAVFTSTATGYTSAAVTATQRDANTSPYKQHFLDLYAKIKAPANGYFSPQGIPFHSVETFIVEAPDYGHETTSEAFSYWIWLEANYGQATGDWTNFNNAWAMTEKFMIPQHADQPTNSFYNASKPATYAPENDLPSQYPSPIDSSVPVGSDPIASELQAAYGTSDIYGMHWLADADNRYGYGDTPGGGCENGPSATGLSLINSYQRGPQESVFETIPQPTCDKFAFGGPNGYLDLFIKDSSYAKQWKFTDAPDADARAVQATYWALQWATQQGKATTVQPSVDRAAKMGDYLRYSFFDKYFKKIGNCTSPTGCAAGTGKDSEHYLLSWYYAWGGALDTSAGWAWRIGDGASHQGYQNPLAAFALSQVTALKPKSATGATDWTTSLGRQLEFYTWLQSSEGAIAGGATNSWGGHYGTPPAGDSTFYGMAYDPAPVYHDPDSNQWFGFQAWSMERVAEYYNVTGDAKAKAVLDKWVTWAKSKTTVAADGTFQIPSTLSWTGQPATWNPSSPAANTNLHVTVVDFTNDVGVAAAYAKTLLYYAARSGDTGSQTLGKQLLDGMWTNYQDTKGISVPETKTDYKRLDDAYDPSTSSGVFVPSGWTGKMPNGDPINSNSTFLSIRSWYQTDPDWPKVQAYLNGTGPAPVFNYHRFWAESDIAMAMETYAQLFG
jgi:hypothetical protein